MLSPKLASMRQTKNNEKPIKIENETAEAKKDLERFGTRQEK